MNTATALQPAIPNIISLPPRPDRRSPQRPQRFKVIEFSNRTGTTSYRVAGTKRDGGRVRENFTEIEAAQCRQIELETEYLRGHAETTIRATKLSAEQVQLAEVAFIKLGDDWQRILDAVDHWTRTGAKNLPTDAPRIDDAVDQYLEWLKTSPLRDATKRHWRIRMTLFKNSVPNIRVSDATPETIEAFLEKRKVSMSGKDTDRRAVSRFFSWCIARPRRWTITNPCREVDTSVASKPPVILTVDESEALLRAVEKYKQGRLVPYFVAGLFGGLRPFEVRRLTWSQVNLEDGEIRLEAWQTKNDKPRTVAIDKTLKAWLTAHKDKPFFPSNWRKDFESVTASVGFGTPTAKSPSLKNWTPDILRHTACSHFFRKTGSYGLTAEQFDNSEAIIKKHYQSRVSTKEMQKFYAIMPAKKGARKKDSQQ